MKTYLLLQVLLSAIFILSVYNHAQADIIYESATMGPSGQYSGGYAIDSMQFIGARFYVSSTVQVTAIGGHLYAIYSGDDVFGAIVKLNSSTDLPKGLPFNSSEVAAQTILYPSYYSSDIRVPLSCTLTPGYYGLVFGSGLYGATGMGSMPYTGQSDLPGASYFFWLDDGIDYGWYNISALKVRFVVEGTVVSPGYCSASGGCDEYISNVTVGTINNSSGCGGYQDFTSLSTIMARETAYSITVTNGNPWSQDLCGIWIDWNRDLDFTDADETITMINGSGVGPYTATIIPPVAASLGSTRMRVRIQYGGTLSPCGTTDYGEVEDYNIIVTTGSSTINISGCIKASQGVRIKGINVNASTGQSTTTDALGQYNLTLPAPYSGTITPSQTDWIFNPTSKTYSSITTNMANQDFNATYTVTYPGNGTPDNPYLIYTAAQLNAIGARANDWFYDFKLMADIDLSGYDGKAGRPAFNRIGYYINNGVDHLPFAGTFDGAGHTISNFTFDSNCGIDGVGLFGYLYYLQSQIKNVKLVNVDVNSTSWIGTGALLGFGAYGNVYGCSVKGGKVSSGDSSVGGLIGFAIEGLTINCDANVNVSGDMWAGGLIGNSTNNIYDCNASCAVTGHTECGGLIGDFGSRKVLRCSSSGSVTISYSSVADRTAGGLIGSNSGIIEQCYSKANVSGGSCSEIGGLVGRNLDKIINSYAAGSVSGSSSVGGLAGLCWDANVLNCYSTGAVNATSSPKGGLIGYNIDGDSLIIDSFWDKETSGLTTSNGGTGKTTAEMKTLSTFTDAGWDFADKFENGDEEIWSISPGNYPRLSWQNEKYGGGSGTPDDPYLIFTHRHLNNIGNDLTDCNKCFRMMADIDLYSYSDNQFHIIGTDINPFTGVFDGNDYNITNFTYHSMGIDYIGLFRAVSGLNSVIKKVGFINPDVNGGTGDYVGALTGIVKNEAAIKNCFVEDGSVKGTLYIGGLVGSDSNRANINDCYNSDTLVKGTTGTGGIEGYHSTATIGGCFSEGGVLGTVASTGGLIGLSTGGTVHHSYSTANVGTNSELGGLIGSASSTTVLNCYSTGHIVGSSYKGGLIGRNPSLSLSNTILNSFWDVQTSGVATSVDGGTGLPTAQMQDVNTFLNAGWDFVDQNDGPSDLWSMPSGSYPILWWQLTPWPELPAFSGGDGSTENPYLISTPQELINIGYNPRLMLANFMLANDIDMTDVNYNQIGTRWYPFLASFYGQQHEIHNLHIDCNGIDYVGLIGRAYGTPATIQDIGLISADINAGKSNYVGSLVGYAGRDVNLSNCYTENCVVTGNLIIGGLIGANVGTIEHCYAKGVVEANGVTGLLCGASSGQIYESFASGTCDANNSTAGQLLGNNSGEIYRCYANGTTRAKINLSGGLAGDSRGNIFDCYAKGTVYAGNAGAGGLVGQNWSSYIISRCYSTCAVDGNLYVGGLVGYASNPNDVTASFWDLITSGEPNSAGGTGKTTGEMKTKSTFTNAGWDFVGETANGPNDIWTINEGFDYPRFAWQTYCSASIINDCYEHISSVQVGSINNVTDCTPGGYADYTSLTTTMTPGTGYPIIVTNGDPYELDKCGIWIDWNQDDDFDDESEAISVSDDPVGATFTATITPPITAVPGITRMRIRIVYEVTPIPCGALDWGETEDYTIMVEAAQSEEISVQLDLSSVWMYQNLPGRTDSNIIADAVILNDPLSNSAYTYTWEIELPGDVTVPPITVTGGSTADANWTFAAPSCNTSGDLSDSGLTFKVKVQIVGSNFGNSGTAEKEFAIALLGDVDNNGIVDGRDRTIINSFWRTGSAGPYTFKDCNLNCDNIIDGRDRQIANSVWRGMIGSNSVSVPCPLR